MEHVIGQKVTFLHQAKGKSKNLTGYVHERVPSGKSALAHIPEYVKHSQIQFKDKSDVADRVIVSVERGGKSTMNDYYAPYAHLAKPV